MSLARADEALPAVDDFDGFYLTAGPTLSLTRSQGDWVTAAGGELSALWLGEHCVPALVGVTFGGQFHGNRDGGRIWGEAEVAFNRPLPVPVGLAVGASMDIDHPAPADVGAHATLWMFAGVVPFIRVGSLERSGSFVELGVAFKLPWRVWR